MYIVPLVSKEIGEGKKKKKVNQPKPTLCHLTLEKTSCPKEKCVASLRGNKFPRQMWACHPECSGLPREKTKLLSGAAPSRKQLDEGVIGTPPGESVTS